MEAEQQRDRGRRPGAFGDVAAPLTSVMADRPLGVRPCSMAAALEIVGERWSLLVLRELAYGVHRFGKIVGYTGAPRDILTDRLRKLEAAGVIERRQYCEHPPRYEYHLTQAGHELFPAMMSLLLWGDKWALDSPAVAFEHECGKPLSADVACRYCAGQITPHSLRLEPRDARQEG